jgi:3-phenylpropionate/trans-cinnamate dioxygenase ferredoxin reductase subunit
MSERIVIVGAGHAGTQAAVSLRQGGFDGAITLVSEESDNPYQRPPLSKKYLTGALETSQIALRPPAWFADSEVDLRLSARVVDVDLDAARVRLTDQQTLSYDRLLLATGSRMRRLDIPGAQLARVHYLRTATDAVALRETLAHARRLAIVGGGYIGLEVASSAREMGLEVLVLEQADRLLPRVASSELAQAVARLHEAGGVEVRCSAEVTALQGAQQVEQVRLADGGEFDVDAVVVGIGVEAETALAEQAGLNVDDGIVVDEYCQASNPQVYAAGDCTSHPNRFLRCRVRLESVPNATQQGRTAAASMLGRFEPYGDAPWFWSEQFGTRMQTAGLPDPEHETILRGDPAGESFALYHLAEGRLMAVEALNRVQEFMLGRKLIEAQVQVDDALADDGRPIKDIVELYLGDAV